MSSKNHELLLHVESAKLISYQLEAVLSVWLESLPEKIEGSDEANLVGAALSMLDLVIVQLKKAEELRNA